MASTCVVLVIMNYQPVTVFIHRLMSANNCWSVRSVQGFLLTEEVYSFNWDTFSAVIMPYYRRLSGEMFFLVKFKYHYTYVTN